MRLMVGYPVFVTEKLLECRSFYERLGFRVIFEATWFLYLSAVGDAFALAFIAPDHPSTPPDPKAFNGGGAFLTLQVDDAAAVHEILKGEGFSITYDLRDEPWGQRRFALIDPAGIWLDIVEQIEPEPGFWAPYVKGLA